MRLDASANASPTARPARCLPTSLVRCARRVLFREQAPVPRIAVEHPSQAGTNLLSVRVEAFAADACHRSAIPIDCLGSHLGGPPEAQLGQVLPAAGAPRLRLLGGIDLREPNLQVLLSLRGITAGGQCVAVTDSDHKANEESCGHARQCASPQAR